MRVRQREYEHRLFIRTHDLLVPTQVQVDLVELPRLQLTFTVTLYVCMCAYVYVCTCVCMSACI